MPLLVCSFVGRAATTGGECVHVCTHLRRGRERARRKKNFRKTNCWKKRNDIAKKECIQPPPTEKKRTERRISFYPYTDDEYTNIFKKEICRWNKLLELELADHFSKRGEKTRKKNRREGGSETRNIKINRFGTQKSDFTRRNV